MYKYITLELIFTRSLFYSSSVYKSTQKFLSELNHSLIIFILNHTHTKWTDTVSTCEFQTLKKKKMWLAYHLASAWYHLARSGEKGKKKEKEQWGTPGKYNLWFGITCCKYYIRSIRETKLVLNAASPRFEIKVLEVKRFGIWITCTAESKKRLVMYNAFSHSYSAFIYSYDCKEAKVKESRYTVQDA